MFFYIFIFVILSLLALLSQNRSAKDQRLLGIISAIIVVCVQGFRWRTGTDWEAYYDCFIYSNRFQVEYVEWGYYMFNRIIRYLTASYTIFLLIQCGLIAFCHFKIAEHFQVKNVALVMLCSFASTPFPVRFTMAVSIFLLAYRYVEERNLTKFLVFYIAASMCHQIVALTLPVYFICHKQYSNKFIYIAYAVCCGLGLLTEYVFSNMLNGLALIFNLLPEFSQDKASAYMIESDEERSLISTILSFLNGAFFIFLFTKVKDKFYSSNNKFNILLNMYVFGLCFGRVVIGAVPYLSRINVCLAGGFTLMIYLSILSFKTSKRSTTGFVQKLLILLFILYISVSYFGKVNGEFDDLYIPYFSIFSSTQRIIVY